MTTKLSDPFTNSQIHPARAHRNNPNSRFPATVAELNAIFGWTGTAMASLYTEEADRKRLALQAMDKLAANKTAISAHAPNQKVRVRNPKP